MNKYTLKITRTRTDIGYVAIEAESKEDALRKYYYPDSSKGEYVIFDDEIDWLEDDGDYKTEVLPYIIIDRNEAIIRWCNNKPVLLIYDDGTEAYAEKVEDILFHDDDFGYEVEEREVAKCEE